MAIVLSVTVISWLVLVSAKIGYEAGKRATDRNTHLNSSYLESTKESNQ